MPQVTIISIWSKFPPERPHNLVYTVDVPAGATAEATLENAFAATNRDDRPRGQTACSTSAGDLMVLNGQHYLVEDCGYTPVTEAEATLIQTLDSRDTSGGYDFLKSRRLIHVPNARIWISENLSPVKITLKPGQTLKWNYFHPDEEGYSAGGFRLEWDGTTLIQTWGMEATDCDGRIARGGILTTTVDQFKACEPYIPIERQRATYAGVRYPQWTTVSRNQRDYAAEAAGY